MSFKTDIIILSWSPHVDLSNYVDFCLDIDFISISPQLIYIYKQDTSTFKHIDVGKN